VAGTPAEPRDSIRRGRGYPSGEAPHPCADGDSLVVPDLVGISADLTEPDGGGAGSKPRSWSQVDPRPAESKPGGRKAVRVRSPPSAPSENGVVAPLARLGGVRSGGYGRRDAR